ncbi:MAG: hypothetical protein V4864_20390 [Pseudomonadota bacterium]
MTTGFLFRLCCGLLLSFACAAQPAGTAASRKDLAGLIPAGQKIVSRLDADVTGDNLPDAVVVTSSDSFEAFVWVFRRLDGTRLQALDTLELDLTPNGPPTVSVKNGVLVVESMTGSASVRTLAFYRYRWDAQASRLRLIGLDAERTGSDIGLKLSWNVLTGKRLVRWGKKDPAVFVYGPETASSVPPAVLRMADTPKPEDLLDELVEKRRN